MCFRYIFQWSVCSSVDRKWWPPTVLFFPSTAACNSEQSSFIIKNDRSNKICIARDALANTSVVVGQSVFQKLHRRRYFSLRPSCRSITLIYYIYYIIYVNPFSRHRPRVR